MPTLTFRFDDIPHAVVDGFEIGSHFGEAEIMYDADGFTVTDIWLKGLRPTPREERLRGGDWFKERLFFLDYETNKPLWRGIADQIENGKTRLFVESAIEEERFSDGAKHDARRSLQAAE